MGKSQRRRATRKSHHESAKGRVETNVRAPGPGSLGEPVLYDVTMSYLLVVAYFYSLPLVGSALRITAWYAFNYIVQCLDAPRPLRCLAAACTNYLIYYCFFAEAWAPFSNYMGPLVGGLLLIYFFVGTSSHFLSLTVILRTFGVPRVIGFLVVGGLVSYTSYYDIFCDRELAAIIYQEDSIVTSSAPVRKRPRFETNAARKQRWAYWRLYYSKRGNEAALKRLEKLERRACDICGRQADVDEPRCAVCDGCGERRYCGVLCQRVDWIMNKHSENCSGASR